MRSSTTTTDHYHLRSGLILLPPQLEAIERLLSRIQEAVHARLTLLADVTGQIVSARGERDNIDLVALGSLVAGDLAASHEIARLTGQYQNTQMVLREGETTHTLICEAGHQLVLMVQIPPTSPLGWARINIRQATKELVEITTRPPAAAEEFKANLAELAEFKEADLSAMFDDALDELELE